MTAAPPSLVATPPGGTDGPRPQPLASRELDGLRRRVRTGIWCEALGVLLPLLLGYAVLTYAIDRNLRLEVPFRAALLLALLVLAVRSARRRLLAPLRVPLDDDEIALAVERQAPSLQETLISSMQFERALDAGRTFESQDLMRAVVADARHRVAAMPFANALDARRVRNFAARAAGVLLVFAVWGGLDGHGLWLWARRNLALSAVEWPRYTSLHFVGADAGVVRLPQGDPLTVRVAASGEVPDQVYLRTRSHSGEVEVEQMSRTGDGEYTRTIETLIEDAELVAEGGDGFSAPLRVQIVERPRIEEFTVDVVFPAYMNKAPERVPLTEGEVRLLRGSELRLAAKSHKPVVEAFALFAEQKVPLERDGDHAFHGALTPRTSGLLVVDVIDRDQLGAGAPPRLQVRVVDDKAPTIDFKLRGISSLVTPQVAIPGDLKVKDDFGVTVVSAAWRATDDAPEHQPQRRPDDVPPAEAPFLPIGVAFETALVPGVARFESTATVDFKPLNRAERDDDPQNPVRPGMLLSLRFQAKDNFGPGEPHEAIAEAMTFRVVTRDKLVEELRRRQVEQRQEVLRIRDEEATALLSLGQNPNPTGADPRVRQQLKSLAARQQTLGRQVAFIADVYQRILWEYENNRIWEPGKVREFEKLTAGALTALAREPFPATAHQVATFADGGDEELRTAAADGYKDIVARLEAIAKVMEQVETLAALIEQVRGVIKDEDRTMQAVERRLQEAGRAVFGNDKPKAPEQPKKTGK